MIDPLRALFEELLEKYADSEESNIVERSSDFDKDRAELAQEIASYRTRFNELMEGRNHE